MKVHFVTNSAEPDQLPHFAESGLVLHCLWISLGINTTLIWVEWLSKAIFKSQSTFERRHLNDLHNYYRTDYIFIFLYLLFNLIKCLTLTCFIVIYLFKRFNHYHCQIKSTLQQLLRF